MFDEGQALTSPYHRTKFESEKLVRDEATVPWRVYRPAIVVGHSETGAMDKVDGPYYLFPAIKVLRDALPAWLPLVGVDLGDTNLVPVDYVAAALDRLAHLEGRDGEAFHLVNPEPQPVVEMLNAFCAAAGAPQFATPLDRSSAGGLLGLVPGPLRAPAPRHQPGPHRPGADAARPDPRPDRHPGRGARPHVVPLGVRLPPHREGAGRLRASPSPTSSPTPARCGATGRTTSTSRPPTTPARARR